MDRADQDGSRRTTASAEISPPEIGGDGATAPPPPAPQACTQEHMKLLFADAAIAARLCASFMAASLRSSSAAVVYQQFDKTHGCQICAHSSA